MILISPAFSQDTPVRINELNFKPGVVAGGFEGQDHEWVELYNPGPDSIDLSGWVISNRDGTPMLAAPPWFLPARCFLTLHNAAGGNDSDFTDLDGHYYAGPVADFLDDNEDECAVYSGSPGPTTIQDFVSWSGTGSYTPGTASSYAASQGIWTPGDYVNSQLAAIADNLARYFDGYDRNIPADWRTIPWPLYAHNAPLQPENPIQESPMNRSVVNTTTPTLDWSDFPSADSFQVQLDDNYDFSSPLVDKSGLTLSEFTVVGSLADNAYFYRVRAFVGGSPTPWAAEWLFVVLASYLRPTQIGGTLSCPHKWQHKDSKLLCLYDYEFGAVNTRPGCPETGPCRWDVAHPNSNPDVNGCAHARMYCVAASIAMMNAKYAGDLTQDRITYQVSSTRIAGVPEEDLGHNEGMSPPPGSHEEDNALSWALSGAAIAVQAGPFTFAQMKSWVDSLDCFMARIPGHMMVVDGYAEITTPGGTLIQVIYVEDPWLGPNYANVFSYVIEGVPKNYTRRHRGNRFAHVFLQPTSGVVGRKQETSVTTDSDGDGIMNFDEGAPDYPYTDDQANANYNNNRPRRLDSKPDTKDTDRDQVEDKNEVRNYTFHKSWHPSHPVAQIDAVGFPDIDGDGMRAEGDCDADSPAGLGGDGDFDGGEDIDGNGHNPDPGKWPGDENCTRETCVFDNADYCIKVAVDKDSYFLGEPVFVVDIHGSRETHTYHRSSTYNYEKGDGCPVKPNGSALGHNGSFSTDAGGHAKKRLVEHCLQPGQRYLTVDVLDDSKYSTPDNLDPQTCWICKSDWFHGWHYGYDWTYHNHDIPYPRWQYPAVCQTFSSRGQTQAVTIHCPWWWWCYQWPPVLDDYWLGVAVPRELVTAGLVTLAPPMFILRPDSLPPGVCNGAPINQFQPDSNVTRALEENFSDPKVAWFGYSIQGWQIPDSHMTTQVMMQFSGHTSKPLEQLFTETPIQVKAGDAVYGWSPTSYDSITLGYGTASVSVAAKWNILSTPVDVLNDSVEVLFPSANTPYAFSFSSGSGYTPDYTMERGPGFWLKFDSAQTFDLFGTEVTEDSIDVAPGWNIIGSVSDPVSTGAIVPVNTSVVSQYFAYDAGYVTATDILPGSGYWVKVDSAGKLVLSSALAKADGAPAQDVSPLLAGMNRFLLTDAEGRKQQLYLGPSPDDRFDEGRFELPPPPPAGVFDARFASGRYVEAYPAAPAKSREYSVELSSAAYPIVVTWDLSALFSDKISLAASGAGRTPGDMLLGQKGSISITDPRITSLKLRVRQGGRIPTEFALQQSYPNPFNPSAVIGFDLPKASVVTLKIYDVMGREVATLADAKPFEAGSHQLQFDGSGFASGLYFYRIAVVSGGSTFVDIRKMVLVK